MKTFDFMQNLKKLESQYFAAKAAIAYYHKECHANRASIPVGFNVRDIRDCLKDLDTAYILRLFAEFELSLRLYWRNQIRNTKPIISVLLESLAARRDIPDPVKENAHTVRCFRNSIVHGGHAAHMTIPEARNYLCTFIAGLPHEWQVTL